MKIARMRSRIFLSLTSAVAVISCGRSGESLEERDVRGNYDISYDDQLRLRLNIAGVVRELTANGYGGVADFGVHEGQPVQLDLTQFCAREDVTCPNEALWAKVSVDQPDLTSSNLNLQKLVVINNTVHELDAGERAASLAGLVDNSNDDRFLLGLGLKGGVSGSCAALGVSLAGGRFSREGEHEETTQEWLTGSKRSCDPDAGIPDAGEDAGGPELLPDGGLDCALTDVTRLVFPEGAVVDGIKEGRVYVGWAAGCAFGPFLAGAVLTIDTGYTGTRTGDFDPPPFIEPEVVLPDGGVEDYLDAGEASDGGP